MTTLSSLETINPNTDVAALTAEIITDAEKAGYRIVEVNDSKPWGAYVRINNDDADKFIEEFFPGLTPNEARLGDDSAEVSPKFLIVAPGQRLSLQTHARRAERWRFLTPGSYVKGVSEETAEQLDAAVDDVVQFQTGDLHRLCGLSDGFVVVAEIWQHADPAQLSDEDDISRLQDDYSR